MTEEPRGSGEPYLEVSEELTPVPPVSYARTLSRIKARRSPH